MLVRIDHEPRRWCLLRGQWPDRRRECDGDDGRDECRADAERVHVESPWRVEERDRWPLKSKVAPGCPSPAYRLQMRSATSLANCEHDVAFCPGATRSAVRCPSRIVRASADSIARASSSPCQLWRNTQRERADRAGRIGDVAARERRRRPVHRLVQRSPVAQARRRQQAERSGYGAGLVREDVAEQVLGEHHVVARRIEREVHRERIHVLVLERDVGIVGRHRGHGPAPQLRRLEHVGLVHREQPLAARPREQERHARHPLHFADAVLHRVERRLAVGRDAARLAEVEPAEQLADDDQVGARRALRLEGRGVLEPLPRARRPQVRIHAHRGPQRQQAGLDLLFARQVIERRITNGTEQDRLARRARGTSLVRIHGQLGAQRGAANREGTGVDLVGELATDGLEDDLRGRDDLRADAVAWKQHERTSHAADDEPGQRRPSSVERRTLKTERRKGHLPASGVRR